MNALLRTAARGLTDRAVEIIIVGALGVATMCLTWWFTIPTVLAAAWWVAVEVRLWRAHRAAPASASQAGAGCRSRRFTAR
ncbi:hypothetical protein Ae717Ps2_6573 [Pseudonocardia sp. Ae717_Ps2]|uniref:hypothetical protein n=1 Tax=Pseudonocardia sp. Ae717_Ps2 TaxID=1885573 RepID=UPI00094B0A5D|nr:hypothetical protein [Pseudonocardia sp. Ae717_Ps2]OLM28318.1 hypothetical protein Ae717Ps2_6520 [Pseudonocardia sp. Ae717_Ps2]OLM28335.1 hypothetical protein Ae717Ps2_6537 [Pseudonocardia sp. Ae717_Ps2]OLM28353.1 hypothetical protein Ae717Ps2_6555 [Pseudonocardia sp. Ae717_Ps2]OLM28371.1 hypothetical protein Ae717Ps2_6573 [Pseudonocardia sp. Ae717_Ps2]